MTLDFTVIADNWRFLIVQGLLGIGAFGGGTLALAVPTIVLGFLLGIGVALGRLSARPWLHRPATLYVELIRGVPLVMVVFWFWFFIPIATGVSLPQYWVALVAFVVFEAAYLGEIIRAGIQSVPRGQVEAAEATGLRYGDMMRFVVLPQAVRNMLPSLVTQFIILVKDTSLASIIGYMDLTKAAQTVNQREIRPFELYLFIAVVYWLLTYGMSLGSPPRATNGRRLHAGASPRRVATGAPPGAVRAPVASSGAWRSGAALGLTDAPVSRIRWRSRGTELSDLRPEVDGLRSELQALREQVASLRAAVETGSRQAAVEQEAGEARARKAEEALAQRLATAERRLEELGDGVTGLEAGTASLAEQFARLEAGSTAAVALPRARPSGPRQPGPAISAEELFDRGMESYRAGARASRFGFQGVLRPESGASPHQRTVLDREAYPEPRLRAGGQQVPEGHRPRRHGRAHSGCAAPPGPGAPVAPP
jgi:polar amino acid transport system permease protein